MNKKPESRIPPDRAMELYAANPDVLYGLEAAARLAAVPRRSILVYCRVGLVRAVFQPPYGVMTFTEEAIYTVRRIEDLRNLHGVGVAWIKSMFDLLDEVERLRAEVRFLGRR